MNVDAVRHQLSCTRCLPKKVEESPKAAVRPHPFRVNATTNLSLLPNLSVAHSFSH